MSIFRAVPRDGFNPNQIYKWRDGQRLPGNVPYLVDNLWEFTRPEGKPSRRRAVYASPTAELALDCANAGALSRDKYVPCEVAFQTRSEVFQLSVSDARYHPDLKRVQKLVHGKLANWSERGLDSKLVLAPLFLPGTTREELRVAMDNNAELRAIVEEAAAAVTMWFDVPNTAVGEITFEIAKDNSYTLDPV